jgi:hypothetical protein
VKATPPASSKRPFVASSTFNQSFHSSASPMANIAGPEKKAWPPNIERASTRGRPEKRSRQ